MKMRRSKSARGPAALQSLLKGITRANIPRGDPWDAPAVNNTQSVISVVQAPDGWQRPLLSKRYARARRTV